MDLLWNDPPDGVVVERLPCLKLFHPTGGVVDVPAGLYREEDHALERLSEWLMDPDGHGSVGRVGGVDAREL